MVLKFRYTKNTRDKMIFEPLEPEHVWPDGGKTPVPNVSFFLKDDIQRKLDNPKFGDEREFSVKLTVQTGFEIDGYDS
jgi:hypothetical protein